MQQFNLKSVAYWTATIFGPASFIIGAVMGLRQSPDVVNNIHQLGYPVYFATLLSTWKLLGVLAILAPGFPRLKEWAYAGFVFDLTGAAISQAAVGHGTTDIVVPLVFLVLVIASWALRPASRRLAGSPRDVRATAIHGVVPAALANARS